MNGMAWRFWPQNLRYKHTEVGQTLGTTHNMFLKRPVSEKVACSSTQKECGTRLD